MKSNFGSKGDNPFKPKTSFVDNIVLRFLIFFKTQKM